MESEHLQNSDVNRGHEPVGIPLNRPPGTFSPAGGEGRDEGVQFMGSLHDFSVAHWDHEPLRLTEARSGPRVCDPQPARFMESLGATEFSFREVEERRVQAARMLRCFRAHAG